MGSRRMGTVMDTHPRAVPPACRSPKRTLTIYIEATDDNGSFCPFRDEHPPIDLFVGLDSLGTVVLLREFLRENNIRGAMNGDGTGGDGRGEEGRAGGAKVGGYFAPIQLRMHVVQARWGLTGGERYCRSGITRT